ncbi:hypothetical protein [Caproiciproducens faecalis]|uniref:Uncharacterized protein n=1 Tax=Caproiciproducens faecalis TaxID=2820301 RepID=A0ABS7DLJ3_9FIRM|nr:hypothetical protein [Caproiciproducens faecalis]MBW7572152.1 hypothetical protein [Caproiciproducens faecalis]
MYIYQKSEPGVWSVGYYTLSGTWQQESKWNSAAEAMEHAHSLNEGENSDDTENAKLKGKLPT